MATSFAIIIREVAKHLNAYRSGDASTVNTDYTVATPTTTQVADPFFSLAFIQDKVIDAHGRLALEIANVRAHPWRAWIGNSVTATIASGVVLPLVATNAKSIVGCWGQVLNGGTIMSEAAPERVQQYLYDPLNFNQPNLYYIDGGYIYHTASIMTINCCTYERSTVAALVTSTPPGNITLPDVLVDAIVAGAVMECIIEAKGVEQASYFKTLFEGAIASIRQGQTTMPMMTLKATA